MLPLRAFCHLPGSCHILLAQPLGTHDGNCSPLLGRQRRAWLHRVVVGHGSSSPFLRLSVASLCWRKGQCSMPRRPQKMEGQVVGGMRRLFRKRLPWLRAGLHWITHLLFSRVTLSDADVSSLKCFFLFFLLYLDHHFVPHVTGLGGFPCWFLDPVMPSVEVGVVTATWPWRLF